MWQTNNQYYVKWRRLIAYPLKSEWDKSVHSQLLFSIVLQYFLAGAIWKRKEIQLGKEYVKLPHNILYLNDPKDSTTKHFDPINTFIKIAGHNSKAQK